MATWFLFVSLRKSFCSLPASKALTRRTLLAQVCLQARFFLVLLTLCPCDRLVGPHMKASTMLLNKVVFLHISAHWYPNFNVNIFCLWLSHEFLDPQFSWYSLWFFGVYLRLVFMFSLYSCYPHFPLSWSLSRSFFHVILFTCTCSGFVGHGYGYATFCICVVFKAEWPSAGSRPLCEAAFNFVSPDFVMISWRDSCIGPVRVPVRLA